MIESDQSACPTGAKSEPSVSLIRRVRRSESWILPADEMLRKLRPTAAKFFDGSDIAAVRSLPALLPTCACVNEAVGISWIGRMHCPEGMIRHEMQTMPYVFNISSVENVSARRPWTTALIW
ncbi:hypothetical protein ACLOJK_015521 [Asimina triloba]